MIGADFNRPALRYTWPFKEWIFLDKRRDIGLFKKDFLQCFHFPETISARALSLNIISSMHWRTMNATELPVFFAFRFKYLACSGVNRK